MKCKILLISVIAIMIVTGVFAANPSAKAKWSSEVRIIESGRHWSGPWCDCDGSVVLSDRTSNRTGF